MDRSILQDFEREDDGCVLNSYPSAWVLNRTGGKIVEEKKEDGYKSLLNDLWDKLEGSGDPEEPSRWELEELASSDAVDEIKIDSIPA